MRGGPGGARFAGFRMRMEPTPPIDSRARLGELDSRRRNRPDKAGHAWVEYGRKVAVSSAYDAPRPGPVATCRDEPTEVATRAELMTDEEHQSKMPETGRRPAGVPRSAVF